MPSTEEYIKHLLQHGSLEPEVLVFASIILERFVLSSKYDICFLKLIATVVFSAQKFLLENNLWDNKGFGAIAGLTTNQLNSLEVEYLEEVGFRIFVCYEEYKARLHELAS